MNVSSENPVSASQSPNTGKKKPGRKAILSIYKDKLLALVRSGVSIEDAAIALGIGESTIYLWKQMGAKQRSGMYRRFLEEMKKQEALAKVDKIRVVETDAKTNPKMALELLARKYPKEYGKKDMNMVVGKDGGPMEIEVTDWKRKLAEKLDRSMSGDVLKEIVDTTAVRE